jgi:hypothetical protein
VASHRRLFKFLDTLSVGDPWLFMEGLTLAGDHPEVAGFSFKCNF